MTAYKLFYKFYVRYYQNDNRIKTKTVTSNTKVQTHENHFIVQFSVLSNAFEKFLL